VAVGVLTVDGGGVRVVVGADVRTHEAAQLHLGPGRW
jgi:hypothetical protein